MALITCPECNHTVSEFAQSCPSCGFPIKLSSIDKKPLETANTKPQAHPKRKKYKKLPNGQGSIKMLSGNRGSVFLGNELYTNLSSKMSMTSKHISDELKLLEEVLDRTPDDAPSEEFDPLQKRLDDTLLELKLLKRINGEILKMRMGSIALINQITTISKIRIYDPKTDHDILSNIKLSNEKLDLIDAEMRKKFISK